MNTNRTFRRIFCLVLTFVLLLTCSGISLAAEKKCTCGHSPVIMISGFGATTLAKDGEAVFPPSGDALKSLLKKYGFDISGGLVEFIAEKDINALGKALISLVNEVIEPIRMNKDGTSYYDIKPIVSGASQTSLQAFKQNGMLAYVPYTGSDFLDMQMLGDAIGEDHVFNFTFDWRLSNSVVAEQLAAYIDDVLEQTGHDKVSIYSISQGSLLLGEYLYHHAQDSLLDKIVFDTPLLGGSDLVGDIFNTGDISLNFTEILELLGCILHTEFDLGSFADLLRGDTIHLIVNVGAQQVIKPVTIYASAFWEMLPPSRFEFFKNELLTEESAPMIRQIQSVHNGFMSHISETLQKAETYGADVFIKSCSDHALASGSLVNSDGVVNTEYSCGAACADWGSTFANTYTQKNPAVPYSVSPSRTVDLSCGYYPAKTWIVSGLYHGQVEWDRNSLGLVMKMLLTDEIKDAYSSYEYPQFMVDRSPTQDLALTFDCTNCLFLACQNGKPLGNTLTLTNLSQKNGVVIKSVSAQNGSLNLSCSTPFYLKPGESITVSFRASFDKAPVFDTLTVTYSDANALNKTLTKDFAFSAIDSYGGVVKTNPETKTVQSSVLGLLMCFFARVFDLLMNLFK